MKKLFVIVLIVIFSFIQVALAGGTYYVKDEEELLQQFCFSLDGKEYHLPVKFSQLAEEGWSIDDYYADIILESRYYSYAHIKKGDKDIEVSILNASEEAKAIQDCDIVELRVMSDIDFKLINGPQFGDTVKEVMNRYGVWIDFENGSPTSNGLMWYTMYQDESIIRDYTADSTGFQLSFKLGEKKGTLYSPLPMLTSAEGQNEIGFIFDDGIKNETANLIGVTLQYMMAAD